MKDTLLSNEGVRRIAGVAEAWEHWTTAEPTHLQGWSWPMPGPCRDGDGEVSEEGEEGL